MFGQQLRSQEIFLNYGMDEFTAIFIGLSLAFKVQYTHEISSQ